MIHRVGKNYKCKNLDALVDVVRTGDLILTAPGETLAPMSKSFRLPDGATLRSEKEKVPTTIQVVAGQTAPIMCANWCEGAKVFDINVATTQTPGKNPSAFTILGDNCALYRVKQVGHGRTLSFQGASGIIVDGFSGGDSDDYGIYMGGDGPASINRRIRLSNGGIAPKSKILHWLRIHDSSDVEFTNVWLTGDIPGSRSLFTIKEWKRVRFHKLIAKSAVAGGGCGPLPEDKEAGHYLDDVEFHNCDVELGNFFDLGAGVGGQSGVGVKWFGGRLKTKATAINCRTAVLDRKPPKGCEFHGVKFESPALIKGPREGVKILGGWLNGTPLPAQS